MGLGIGNSRLTPTVGAQTGDTLSEGGLAIDFAIGGTLGAGLVLAFGIAGNSMTHTDLASDGSGYASTDITLTNVGLLVDWYVNPKKGFHVFAMPGSTSLTVSQGGGRRRRGDGSWSTDDTLGRGFGLTVGAGHEWFVSEQWSLGVLGRYTRASLDDPDGGQPRISFDASTFALVGVATYH